MARSRTLRLLLFRSVSTVSGVRERVNLCYLQSRIETRIRSSRRLVSVLHQASRARVSKRFRPRLAAGQPALSLLVAIAYAWLCVVPCSQLESLGPRTADRSNVELTHQVGSTASHAEHPEFVGPSRGSYADHEGEAPIPNRSAVKKRARGSELVATCTCGCQKARGGSLVAAVPAWGLLSKSPEQLPRIHPVLQPGSERAFSSAPAGAIEHVPIDFLA